MSCTCFTDLQWIHNNTYAHIVVLSVRGAVSERLPSLWHRAKDLVWTPPWFSDWIIVVLMMGLMIFSHVFLNNSYWTFLSTHCQTARVKASTKITHNLLAVLCHFDYYYNNLGNEKNDEYWITKRNSWLLKTGACLILKVAYTNISYVISKVEWRFIMRATHP